MAQYVPSDVVAIPQALSAAPVDTVKCMSANNKAFLKLSLSQPYLPNDCTAAVVEDLAPKDFHVFSDGAEQKIQSISAHGVEWYSVRDTLGFHHEWSYTPRGKWSAGDMWDLWSAGYFPRYYLVAFAPPKSAEGSCHQLKVLVDSPKAAVFARDQYCNIQDAASDPLYGTPSGKLMEAGVPSSKHPRIPLSLQAAFFYTGTNTARVDIRLEWPWQSYTDTNMVPCLLRPCQSNDGNPIGVLGIVYKKEDGVVARRFSDLGCCPPAYSMVWLGPPPRPWGTLGPFNLPTHYETQLELPSGEYNLTMVLGDGRNFGRAEEPLRIDAYDGVQLGLSSVVLSKRGRNAAVAAQEAAAAHLAPKYVPLVSKGVQVTPAADRRFRRGEPLVTYFEIYEPLLLTAPATTVWAHLRLVDAKRGAVKEAYPPMNVAPYIQPGSSVIPVTVSLKERKGAYRLEVQATDSAGRTTPWRAANFTVE
jgi:hypothetical protein